MTDDPTTEDGEGPALKARVSEPPMTFVTTWKDDVAPDHNVAGEARWDFQQAVIYTIPLAAVGITIKMPSKQGRAMFYYNDWIREMPFAPLPDADHLFLGFTSPVILGPDPAGRNPSREAYITLSDHVTTAPVLVCRSLTRAEHSSRVNRALDYIVLTHDRIAAYKRRYLSD